MMDHKKDRFQLSLNFFLDEFVPPQLHKAGAQQYFDPKLVTLVQEIRNETKQPILINNWWRLLEKAFKAYFDKNKSYPEYPMEVEAFIKEWVPGAMVLDERCVRMPNTTTGAKFSRHKPEMKGGSITRKTDAIDIQIGTMTGPEMLKLIEERFLPLCWGLGIRRFEDPSITPGWLHMDMKDHGKPGFSVINLTSETRFIPFKP